MTWKTNADGNATWCFFGDGLMLSCGRRDRVNGQIQKAFVAIFESSGETVLAEQEQDGNPSLASLRRTGKAFAVAWVNQLLSASQRIPDIEDSE